MRIRAGIDLIAVPHHLYNDSCEKAHQTLVARKSLVTGNLNVETRDILAATKLFHLTAQCAIRISIS